MPARPLRRRLAVTVCLVLAVALLAPAAGAAGAASSRQRGDAQIVGAEDRAPAATTLTQEAMTCVNTAAPEPITVAAEGKPLGYMIDTTQSDTPDFTAQLAWGDGGGDAVRVTERRVYVIEHAYTEPGDFAISFRADGSLGGEACSNPDAKVADVTSLPDYTTRLSGAERLSTSVAISQDLWDDGEADAVVLARADAFPDALAGAALAVAKKGPLLLTPVDELAEVTAEELERVLSDSGTVYLLGGEVALTGGVEDAVTELGFEPVRLGGTSRLDTAARIADEVTDDPGTIFLTWGYDFPDALVAGSVAGDADGVVLLTEEGAPGGATAEYLDDHADAELVAVGGVARDAVPDAEPIVGANRFDTSAKVAAAYYEDATSFAIASGATFPDALGGAAHAGALGIPLLLSGVDEPPAEITAFFDRDDRDYDPGYLYGGRAALSQEVAAIASVFIAEP